MVTAENDALIAAVVGVVLGVCVLDSALLAAWIAHDFIAARVPRLFAARWSLLHVWFAGQAVVMLLIGTIGAIFAAVGPAAISSAGPGAMPLWLIVVASVFQNAFLVAVPAFVVFGIYRAASADIGLSRMPTRSDLAWGLGAGVLLLGLGAVAEQATNLAMNGLLSPSHVRWLREIGDTFSLTSVVPREQVRASAGAFAAIVFAAAVAAPIGEEFFFRAFLHRCARARLGAVGGTLVSASAFALVHGGPILVISILPMGAALAVVYDWRKSLWVPILMHAVNNAVSIVLAYYG